MSTLNHMPSRPPSQIYGINKFNSLYSLPLDNVEALTDFLTSATFINNIKLLFESPVENVISLRVYPLSTGGAITEPIQIGNINTGISGARITTPMSPVNVCVFNFQPFFNSFLDYAPYTSIEVFLPYIGFVALDPQVVMGHYVYVQYVIDVFSGKCTAFIQIYDDDNLRQTIMTADGQIGTDVQLGGGQAAEISRNMLKLGASTAAGVVSIAAGVASGGASVPATVAAAGSLAANTGISAISAGQVHISKGSPTQPSIFTYAPQKAYAIITRPVIAEPADYAKLYGRPCAESHLLGDLTGFTVVDNVHVEGLPIATDAETAEIERLLKSGVIF